MSDRKTQSGFSFNPSWLSNVSTNVALNSINGRVQHHVSPSQASGQRSIPLLLIGFSPNLSWKCKQQTEIPQTIATNSFNCLERKWYHELLSLCFSHFQNEFTLQMLHHSRSFPLLPPWHPKQINKETQPIALKCFKAAAKVKLVMRYGIKTQLMPMKENLNEVQSVKCSSKCSG